MNLISIRLICYLSFSILFTISLKAQDTYLKEVVPPSPNAASLGQYGEIPVSYFSGTPQINIPLWQLTAKDISLPISLSYHASGVKVEQVASQVGMGWSLNAGGVITRTVRGESDRINANGELQPPRNYLPIAWPPSRTDFNNLAEVAFGHTKDSEPDIFYYNFNGRSGGFHFDANGQSIITPHEDIRIEYINTDLYEGKFIVTTEDGTQYYFEETETTSITAVPSATTAWYLTKIVNVNRTDSIELFYQRETYIYQNLPHYSEYYRAGNQNYLINIIASDLPAALADKPCRRVQIEGVRIQKIVSPNWGTIDFIPSDTPRKDVLTSGTDQAYAISQIIVKDVNGIEKRNFRLVYTNVKSTEEYTGMLGYDCPSSSNEYMNYRMYLDKIIESSEKNYSFYYYERNSLPHRLSPAQDWSGYYNGQDLNENLIPAFSDYFSPDLPENSCSIGGSPIYPYPTGVINIQGADRTPAFPEVTYGTLQSIQYPTGGTSEFIFEPHDQAVMGANGGFRIKEIIKRDADGTVLNNKQYTYSVPLPGYGQDFFSYTYYSPEIKVVTFFPNCFIIDNAAQGYAPTLQISTGPFNDLGAYSGSHIGYQYVTERESGNGYTQYEFTNFKYSDSEEIQIKLLGYSPAWEDYISGGVDYRSYTSYGNKWPYGPQSNNSWKRGMLLNKRVYDKNGAKVSREEYIYSHVQLGNIPGIKVQTVQQDLLYAFSEINFPIGWNRLDEKRTYIYNSGAEDDVVISTEIYEYNSSHHKQVTKNTFLQSNGDNLETTFVYPTDVSSLPNTPASVLTEMTQRNMIGAAIKTETSILSGPVVNGQITNFQLENDHITRKSVEKYRTDGQYEKRVDFLHYDTRNNLLSYQGENGITTSFIWGYNKSLPIAQAVNAESAQIAFTNFEETIPILVPVVFGNWHYYAGPETITDQDAHSGQHSFVGREEFSLIYTVRPQGSYKVSFWGKNASVEVDGVTYQPIYTDNRGWSYYEGEINTNGTPIFVDCTSGLLDDLRIHPIDAQMSTYTYDPPIGMTSQTDPNNITTYYEYDALGRLELIRDHENSILKKYSYHYGSPADISP